MIVADTGPLIAFSRIGRLDLLRQVVDDLRIPEAVSKELTHRPERPGAREITRSDWIRRQTVQDETAVAALPRVLHRGEREAIVLAQELGAGLLIDERRGRAIARARGVRVVGSLWVLAEAKQHGIIDRVKPLVDAVLAEGYWIDADLLVPFLQALGETP